MMIMVMMSMYLAVHSHYSSSPPSPPPPPPPPSSSSAAEPPLIGGFGLLNDILPLCSILDTG